MSDSDALASHEYLSGSLDDAFEFLKRTRDELRTLRKVRVWEDRLRIYDVNGDCFEITGAGYSDEDIVPLLDAVNTAYKRESIHQPFAGPYKEFKTGRRYPWAQDRVM